MQANHAVDWERDPENIRDHTKRAKCLTLTSIILGGVVFVIGIIVSVVMIANATKTVEDFQNHAFQKNKAPLSFNGFNLLTKLPVLKNGASHYAALEGTTVQNQALDVKNMQTKDENSLPLNVFSLVSRLGSSLTDALQKEPLQNGALQNNDFDLPDMNLPDTGLPNMKLPDTGLPDMSFPDTGFPKMNLPATDLSDIILPGMGLPNNDLQQNVPRSFNDFSLFTTLPFQKQLMQDGSFKGTHVQNKSLKVIAEQNNAAFMGSTVLNKASLKGTLVHNNVALKGTTVPNNAALKGTTAQNKADLKGTTVHNNAALKGTTVSNNTTMKDITAHNNTALKGTPVHNNAVLEDTTEHKNAALKNTTVKNNPLKGTTEEIKTLKSAAVQNKALKGTTEQNRVLKGTTCTMQNKAALKGTTEQNRVLKGTTVQNKAALKGPTEQNKALKGTTEQNRTLKRTSVQNKAALKGTAVQKKASQNETNLNINFVSLFSQVGKALDGALQNGASQIGNALNDTSQKISKKKPFPTMAPLKFKHNWFTKLPYPRKALQSLFTADGRDFLGNFPGNFPTLE